MRKFAVVVIGFCLLVTGCKASKVSDMDKQARIRTIYRQYAKEFPAVEGITAAELRRLKRQGKNLVLVDVRSLLETSVSYIPSAITTAEFERDLAQYQNSTVIVYCTIGYRSGLYAQKLQQQGIEVLNLRGGLLAWSYAKGKLTDGTKDTRQVHVFSRQWQLTRSSYEPIW